MSAKVSNGDTFLRPRRAKDLMSGSKLIIGALREQLRLQGLTYRELATALGVSEPTVKRDLTRGNFSLDRLDRICEVLGIGLDELVRGERSKGLLKELDAKQEAELIADPRLLLVTYLTLNDWKFEEMLEAFSLGENELVSLLLRLDTMKLIDYRPPSRMRKLTARNFSWRKDGPVHQYFIARILPEFFAAPFDRQADGFHFMAGMLSQGSMRYMAGELQRLAREFDVLARKDATLPLEARDGCSAVMAIRHWEYSEFTRLRRQST